MVKEISQIKKFDRKPAPKFSVIVPVYNVDKFLAQCLDSLINQTLEDFEIICINDGSTDDSLEILNQYAQNDSRFIIVSQENQGQGIARNKALKIAQGKYIVFVDPDDWVELNALEELYKTFNLTDAEVVEFNYCEYNEFSGKTKKNNFSQNIKKYFGYDLKSIPYYSLKKFPKGCLHRVDMHVWARAYSGEFLKKAESVFAPTKHGEDHLFVCSFVLNANKIQYLDKYLYTYRCRNGSAVNKTSDDNFGVFQNCKLLEEYLIRHNFYDKLKDEFMQYQTQVFACHYRNIPNESKEKYKLMCKEILTSKEYKKMLYMVKYHNNSLLEFIFSIKNEQEFGIKRKVITIFGIKIKLRPKQKKVEGQ